MAASIWIAFASGLDWGLSIWMTVLFVSQPNAGASIKKGLLRILGSVASGLVSIAIFGLFSQQPPLLLASICGVFALGIYGMTGPRYQYAWLVFGFTTIIILVKALAGSDQIETLSFERASLVALGVLIVFVADAVFWPVRAEQQLRESLAECSRRLGDDLKQHLDAPFSGRAPDKPGSPPSSPLVQQLALADQARDEIGGTPARARALSRIALLLEGLASRVRLLGRGSGTESSAPSPPVRAALAQFGDELKAALVEASLCLAGDQRPGPFAEALDHSLARFESEQTPHPVLRDVVTLLRRLEEALVALANEEAESKTGKASETAPAAYRDWFHPDPIRVHFALRAGIAGGGVIVLMLAIGWNFEEDLLAMIMAPILAFIVAGLSSTQGASVKLGIGVGAGILLGWLIADLASVFLFAHLDRMPLSLVYPFVIAGFFGYLIVRGSPLGPLGALFGLLTALLPIYEGNAPPENVDTAYGMVCGMFLGLVAALIAQRLLWPSTAMQIFTQRAAAQLDTCLQALGNAERDREGAARDQYIGGIVSARAKQLSLLGQLHAQAQAEPVERALDDTRRAALLALGQDLFDASLRAPRWRVGNEAAAPSDAAAALTSLREALAQQDAMLVASLKASAAALRGSGTSPDSRLREAHAAVDAQTDALSGHADLATEGDTRLTLELRAQLAASGALVESQLQLEAWLEDWHRAQGMQPDSARTTADARTPPPTA
jgi:uncharacterized membrane protein YccC